MPTTPGDLAQLIRQAAEHPGDVAVQQELYKRVEADLYRAARALRARLSPGHTFQTADIVHEAMVEMLAHNGKEWADSRHYVRTAIQVMRHKIVDHARRRRPDKLKSKELRQHEARITEPANTELERAEFLVALDAALEKLRADDAEACEVFVVRYFGGYRLAVGQDVTDSLAQPTAGEKLTLEETARILDRPVSTVGFRSKKAELFLRRELKQFGSGA